MNDQEFLDQYKHQLRASLAEAEPLLEMTPERIEALWQQAEEASAQKQRRRKAPRMSLVRWSLSAAASVALLVGIGLQLWQPQEPQGPVVASWEGGLTSLPQPARADEEPQPQAPISASPRDRLVSPSSQEAVAFGELENFEKSESFENIESIESPSNPPAPSAIRLISEAEYYDLLCSLLPDEPTPSAPDLPEAPLSTPDTLPSFYQPTLRDYLGNLARRIVCDRMPYLCIND